MTTQRVLVRGPRGDATVLHLVHAGRDTCQVTDNKGIVELADGDERGVATVHRSDVFALSDSVQTGDSPDWSKLEPFGTR